MIVIRDPCKRCIVRPCCRQRCNKKFDYWSIRESLSGLLLKISIGGAVLVILYEIFS